MERVEMHHCEGRLPRVGMGESITQCDEQIDGRLLAGSHDCFTAVNFCCYCGYPAKKQVVFKK